MSVLRGQIYWLELGGERGKAIAHPWVVVQDDVFNRSRVPTVIVCALTSRLRMGKEPGNVRLDPGEGGLEKESVVVVSQLEVVEKERCQQLIGQLSEERVNAILNGLRFQQRAFF